MTGTTSTTEVSKYEGYIRHVMEERRKNGILECDQHTLFVACELLNDKSPDDREYYDALLRFIFHDKLYAELIEDAPGDHIGDYILRWTANRSKSEVPTAQSDSIGRGAKFADFLGMTQH